MYENFASVFEFEIPIYEFLELCWVDFQKLNT